VTEKDNFANIAMGKSIQHKRKLEILDLLLFCLLFVIFIAVFPAFSKTVADIIQSVGIGLGALIAGYGGKNLIDSYLLEKQKKRDQELFELRKRYPVEKLNKSFQLIICSEDDPSPVYIYDIKKNIKRWIVNPQTLRDLGFNPRQVKYIEKNEFTSIKWGDNVDTTK